MEDIHFHLLLFTSLLSLILFFSITKIISKPSKNKNPPPSPPRLPILGNLHQLGSLPHQNLRSLAAKHGPIMLLHFGSYPVLVISSAEAAREILKTHDQTFADRAQYETLKKLLYDCRNLAMSSYGEYWRRLRSIFVMKLLSTKKVQSLRYIREEETALFVKKIEECKERVVVRSIKCGQSTRIK